MRSWLKVQRRKKCIRKNHPGRWITAIREIGPCTVSSDGTIVPGVEYSVKFFKCDKHDS